MIPQIWAVVHTHPTDPKVTFINAQIALDNGCTGVFLISMDGNDPPLLALAQEIKRNYPSKKVGINHLTMNADTSLILNLVGNIDATWTDKPGVNSDHTTEMARNIGSMLTLEPSHLFFGSVAFKYQKKDTNPGLAAMLARNLGMIPTTSGPATGKAPRPEKIQVMRNALDAGALAIASGITPENINLFKDLATHILVSTGISKDFYNFDESKIQALIAQCNGWV